MEVISVAIKTKVRRQFLFLFLTVLWLNNIFNKI